MPRVDWQPVEKGIYVRNYGNEKAYLLQAMVRGKRYADQLGVMTIEEARIIRDTLARNRKLGAGPQTWAEMQAAEREKAAAEKIEEEKFRKATLHEERKRLSNTVAKLWDNFYSYRLALRRSAKETGNMGGRWENHIKALIGEIPLAELSREDFARFVDQKRRAHVGDTTIFKCLIDIRRAWHWGLEERLVDRSFPGKSVIRELVAEMDTEKKCYLDPEEARLLIQTLYDRRLASRIDHDTYCYAILGLGLGLRAGEICKLTRQSVERHIIEKTKNKRSRFVHFNFGPVQTMLTERLSLYPPSDPTEPLFLTTGRDGTQKARNDVPRKFYKVIEELGFNEVPKRKGHHLEKIDFHALRHTFATLAAMRGVDHLTLMRLMGHKTASMTLRYIEIADAHQAKYQEQAMQGIFPKELEVASAKEIA